MEYVEVDEDDDYADDYVQLEDGSWRITPRALALWLDDEGGVFSFIQGRGVRDLVEAGVDEEIAVYCENAMIELKQELRRIGAVL